MSPRCVLQGQGPLPGAQSCEPLVHVGTSGPVDGKRLLKWPGLLCVGMAWRMPVILAGQAAGLQGHR